MPPGSRRRPEEDDEDEDDKDGEGRRGRRRCRRRRGGCRDARGPGDSPAGVLVRQQTVARRLLRGPRNARTDQLPPPAAHALLRVHCMVQLGVGDDLDFVAPVPLVEAQGEGRVQRVHVRGQQQAEDAQQAVSAAVQSRDAVADATVAVDVAVPDGRHELEVGGAAEVAPELDVGGKLPPRTPCPRGPR